MSNNEDGKDIQKTVPLDLARTQITTVKTVEGKTPLLMTNQTLRGMRVLAQGAPANPGQTSSTTSTIITTNIVPQAVFKQESGRPQISTISQPTITIHRPAQISLSTTPVIASNVGTSYHVPRGPAVVANLAAPRSNVTSVRAPIVVAAQTTNVQSPFVRPPKTSTPAQQGTAWLTTNSSNGSQIKGATTVLSSPVRGASVTGKSQVVAKAPNVSTIRSSTILHSAITVGQNNQIHSFKTGHNGNNIQTLNNAVTITQMLPIKTQALVYSSGGVQFNQATRLNLVNSQNKHTPTPRSLGQVTTTRLSVPVTQTGARIVTPQQATVLSSSRIATIPTQQQLNTSVGLAVTRTQSVGRLSVTPTVTQVPARTLNLHSLVAVASTQPRNIQTQSTTKIVSQVTPASIHFSSLSASGIKTAASTVTASNRLGPNTVILSTCTPGSTVTTYSLSASNVENQQIHFNSSSSSSTSALQESQNLIELDTSSSVKLSSSPRPSILRKRDHENSPSKAVKNLNAALSNLSQPLPSTSPPSRPESRNNGHSSGGSTTISATSSPGIAEMNEDSFHQMTINNKEDDNKRSVEMSPRKKPRKQQFIGNDIDEHNDDIQFISENNLKKEIDSDENQSEELLKDTQIVSGRINSSSTLRKPVTASLLNSYRQTWKATHNHYLRYSDVRPKDERRPTIMDLANQYKIQEKVNGWKIYHLSTQMEDLAEQEQNVYNQLTELLKCTESHEIDESDKNLNRINELIKGNLQRIKIINDGMIEAKSQIMKIFDHKVHVTDIINRCASKRNFKKREKS